MSPSSRNVLNETLGRPDGSAWSRCTKSDVVLRVAACLASVGSAQEGARLHGDALIVPKGRALVERLSWYLKSKS